MLILSVENNFIHKWGDLLHHLTFEFEPDNDDEARKGKGSKVDDLTKVQLSLTNCPARGRKMGLLFLQKKKNKNYFHFRLQIAFFSDKYMDNICYVCTTNPRCSIIKACKWLCGLASSNRPARHHSYRIFSGRMGVLLALKSGKANFQCCLSTVKVVIYAYLICTLVSRISMHVRLI